jgi:hypothetical protein
MLGRTRSTTRALLLIVLAVSCSESENPAPPANEFAERLVGDYTARSDSAGGMTYWMRFGSDAKRTALTERDNGIRGIAEDDWVVVDDASGAVRINGLDVVASFSQGDSVLTFSPTGPEGIAVYERSGAMPDPQTWVSEIQLLAEFDLPEVGLTDLAWDGTGIWFPGGVLGSLLQRMNPAMDLEIDVSLTAAHSGNAVAYTSKGFWVDDGLQRRLYPLRPFGSVQGPPCTCGIQSKEASTRSSSTSLWRAWKVSDLTCSLRSAPRESRGWKDLLGAPKKRTFSQAWMCMAWRSTGVRGG